MSRFERNSASHGAGLIALVLASCASAEDAPRSFPGELTTLIYDYEDGSTGVEYHLETPDGVRHRLLGETDSLEKVRGSEVVVFGTESGDGTIRVSRTESSPLALPPRGEQHSALVKPDGQRTRRLAVIPIDLGGGVDIQGDALSNRLVSAMDSLRAYYQSAAYGQLAIEADVRPPVSQTLAGCSYDDTHNLAMNVRATVPGTYDHYVYYFGSRAEPCMWAGLGVLGNSAGPGQDLWLNNNSTCRVLAHEFGHNLGFDHASTLACSGATLADVPDGNCKADEYGDRFSVMGGGPCRDLNAQQKAYQRWFGGCNGVSVSRSATFNLLPIERPCNGVQYLKIRAPKARTLAGANSTANLNFYYLELRVPEGFDAEQQGIPALQPQVLIRIGDDAAPADRTLPHTYLLDAHPETQQFDDAGLRAAETFTDPAGGLTIKAETVSASLATVRIDMAADEGASTCLDNTALSGPGPDRCDDAPGSGGAAGGGGRGVGGSGGSMDGGGNTSAGTRNAGGSAGSLAAAGTSASGSAGDGGIGGSKNYNPVEPSPDGGTSLSGGPVVGSCTCQVPSSPAWPEPLQSVMSAAWAAWALIRRRSRRPKVFKRT